MAITDVHLRHYV